MNGHGKRYLLLSWCLWKKGWRVIRFEDPNAGVEFKGVGALIEESVNGSSCWGFPGNRMCFLRPVCCYSDVDVLAYICIWMKRLQTLDKPRINVCSFHKYAKYVLLLRFHILRRHDLKKLCKWTIIEIFSIFILLDDFVYCVSCSTF